MNKKIKLLFSFDLQEMHDLPKVVENSNWNLLRVTRTAVSVNFKLPKVRKMI